MADLKLDVDISAVLQADKALRDFEGRFTDLERAAKRGVTSQDRLLSVFNRLEKAGISLSQVYRSMDTDLNSNSKTAARLENEFQSLSLSNKSAADSARAMEQAFREQEQAAKAQITELDRLKTKYDPLYAASQLYARSLEEIELAHQKGAISAQRQVQLVDQLNLEYQQFAAGSTAATNRFVTSQMASARGMNAMGVGMQQAGYQVGDFLVQIQSGTNAFVAFGQQATQLVGILPMFNSVMGISGTALIGLSAGLGIAIPLLTAIGAAFMRTRESADESSAGISSLEDQLNSARQSLEGFNDQIERLNLGLADAGEQALFRGIREAQAQIAAAEEDLAEARERRGQGSRALVRQAQAELDAAKELLQTREEELENYRKRRAEAERLSKIEEARSFAANQSADLENQIRLMEATLTYGEDSVEVERLRAYQARQAFLFEAMRNNLSLEQLTNLMAIYDEYARLNEILSKPVQGPNLPTTPPRTPRASGAAQGPDAVERLQEEITFRQRILNLSDEERNLQTEIFRITNALGKDRNKYSSDFIANLAQQNLAIQEQERVIQEARQQQEQLADSIANSFGDAFMSIVDGTKTAKDAFRDMARSIIARLYEVMVVERMVQSISGALSPGGSAGNFLSRLIGRESGGSMMPNQPYVVGERGPELVIPGRSATVMNADLTRKSVGGESVVVNQTINVNGGTDPAAIRMEVAKLMPQITNATKTAVIDARRRGGQMKAAFQ